MKRTSVVPGPGSTVLNMDPTNVMTGEVIDTPRGQGEPDGWIWVQWSNGLICSEAPEDVVLTGRLVLIIEDASS